VAHRTRRNTLSVLMVEVQETKSHCYTILMPQVHKMRPSVHQSKPTDLHKVNRSLDHLSRLRKGQGRRTVETSGPDYKTAVEVVDRRYRAKFGAFLHRGVGHCKKEMLKANHLREQVQDQHFDMIPLARKKEAQPEEGCSCKSRLSGLGR
jgi:hypothetical protein